jgi:hypothetical protein
VEVEADKYVIKVLENCCYNYEIIRTAALTVKSREHWLYDARVQDLKLSNKWIKTMLDRQDFRRKRITHEHNSNIPSESVVRNKMREGQGKFLHLNFTTATTWNGDETATNYGAGATYQFCPPGQVRGITKGANKRLRITSMLSINGSGTFAPAFIILKHSKSSKAAPDQSRMRVITNLAKTPGFRVQDGWTLHLWSKELEYPNARNQVQRSLHKVWYLKHIEKGHIITSQHKAYNDTIRMAMFVELVMKPIADRDGKCLYWSDNCSCHGEEQVEQTFADCNIETASYPANTTPYLQVLDVAVNGPLKARLRSRRAGRTLRAMQEYRHIVEQYYAQAPHQRLLHELPPFKPGIPDVKEGIEDLLDIIDVDFNTQLFKQGVERTFRKTGTLPTEEGGYEFHQYNAHNFQEGGILNKITPVGTIVPSTTEEDAGENDDDTDDDSSYDGSSEYEEDYEDDDDMDIQESGDDYDD